MPQESQESRRLAFRAEVRPRLEIPFGAVRDLADEARNFSAGGRLRDAGDAGRYPHVFGGVYEASEHIAENRLRQQHTRRIASQLASSAVEPADLRGLNRVKVSQHSREEWDDYGGFDIDGEDWMRDAAFEGSYGEYDGGTKSVMLENRWDKDTLIHEVGHHVSAMHGTPWQGGQRVESGHLPEEEAFADEFTTRMGGRWASYEGVTDYGDEFTNRYGEARERLQSGQFDEILQKYRSQ